MAIQKNSFTSTEGSTYKVYYLCDLDSEKPISGLNKGDICYAIDTAKSYTATDSVTWQAFGSSIINNLVDGATVAINLKLSNIHMVVLAGNRILTLSNPVIGQCFIIRLKQDAVGSRTITWFAGISWAGGTAPTLTITANKADSLGFVCTGSGTYDGFVVGANI